MNNENEKNKKEIINKNEFKKNTTYRDDSINIEDKNLEDSTKYGEFVSSYFNWITLDEQKKRAEELNNMSKE